MTTFNIFFYRAFYITRGGSVRKDVITGCYRGVCVGVLLQILQSPDLWTGASVPPDQLHGAYLLPPDQLHGAAHNPPDQLLGAAPIPPDQLRSPGGLGLSSAADYSQGQSWRNILGKSVGQLIFT